MFVYQQLHWSNTQILVTSALDKALTVVYWIVLNCVKNMSVHAMPGRAGSAVTILMGPAEEESSDVMTALRVQTEQDNRGHR